LPEKLKGVISVISIGNRKKGYKSKNSEREEEKMGRRKIIVGGLIRRFPPNQAENEKKAS
jgi:hypothetical protein